MWLYVLLPKAVFVVCAGFFNIGANVVYKALTMSVTAMLEIAKLWVNQVAIDGPNSMVDRPSQIRVLAARSASDGRKTPPNLLSSPIAAWRVAPPITLASRHSPHVPLERTRIPTPPVGRKETRGT